MNITAKKVIAINKKYTIKSNMKLKKLFIKHFNTNLNIDIKDLDYINKLSSCIINEYKKDSSKIKFNLKCINSSIEYLTQKKLLLKSWIERFEYTPLILVILIIPLYNKLPFLFIFTLILVAINIFKIIEFKKVLSKIYFYEICRNALKNLNDN